MAKWTHDIPIDDLAADMAAGTLEAITSGDEARRELDQASVAEQEFGGSFHVVSADHELREPLPSVGIPAEALPTLCDPDVQARVAGEVLAGLAVDPSAPRPDVAVQLDERDVDGVFRLVDSGGNEVGRMPYRRTGRRRVTVDETELASSLAETGVGEELFDALVDWAERRGLEVVVDCPYVSRVQESRRR